MGKEYVFRRMTVEEADRAFELVLDRISWMNEKGIKQWNTNHYEEVYPLEHYQLTAQLGNAYLLQDPDDGNMVCFGLIAYEDEEENWDEDASALYLHTFVSDRNYPGAGSVFLEHLEELARQQGLAYLRLDCDKRNRKLQEYYESHEFYPVDYFSLGEDIYEGVMMEKELTDDRLMLMRPTEYYAEQVMDFRDEMLEAGDDLSGCADLESVDSFEEWLDYNTRFEKTYGPDFVPSRIYLAVRKEDRRLVGMMDYRTPLSERLLHCFGNIGYSVRPSERGNRYAEEMLRLLLPICRAEGEEKLLVSCDKDNEASKLTIIRNGGVLENEVEMGGSVILRYWITL